MKYVSDCCEAEVYDDAWEFRELDGTPNIEYTYICSKCHKLCQPIKAAVKKGRDDGDRV